MGGVIDTSAIALCERRGWTARQTLLHLAASGDGELVLPVITAVELIQGIYQAQHLKQEQNRRLFLKAIFETLPPLPLTDEIAWIAGQVRGEQARVGNTLPMADLLIASTALHLNASVITANLRDFTRIPGLRVIPFQLP